MLEYGAFVALGLLLIWVLLLIPLARGTLKAIPFGAASLFLALMVPFFWLGPEITELTILKVGSFKTNAEQASKYFAEIKNIRDKIKIEEDSIRTAVTSFDRDIASAREETKKIQERRANLRTLSEVSSTIISAQSDNRDSYNKLRSWAKDEGFLFREIAQLSVDSIQRDAENTMFGRTMQWEKLKIDPSKLWLPELEQLYKDFDQQNGVDAPNVKVALIQYIATRAYISETTRLTFLSNMMRDDKSLKAAAFAGDSFAKLAKIDFRPLATKEMLDWWENNKDSLP